MYLKIAKMFYFLLRFVFLPLCLLGWVGHQLLVKKRTWSQIRYEAFLALVFILIWAAIMGWVMK